MRHRISIVGRLFTTLALMVALVGLGTASPAQHSEMDADLAAYLAAGGTFADLCGGTTDPRKPMHKHCAACHLIAAAVLPPVSYGPPAIIFGDYDVLVAVAQNIRNAQRLDPARLSRAPPQA